jgi:hypothetical protein
MNQSVPLMKGAPDCQSARCGMDAGCRKQPDGSFICVCTHDFSQERSDTPNANAHAKSVSELYFNYRLLCYAKLGFRITFFTKRDVAYCRRNVIHSVDIGILYFRRVRALSNVVEISFCLRHIVTRELFPTLEQTVGYE